MVQAWLLLPALLAALSLGCGLLVDRLSTSRVSGVLLLPLGLAVIVVLARACVATDATASLATPLVVAAGLTGLVAGRERLRARHLDRWAAGVALAVFAVYAAPVVLSGDPTFAGYGILGDTAVHFVLIDRIMDAGTGLAGLEPSSYEETLRRYFASGYPLGAHAALGAVRPLAGADVAWGFQPFLAYIGSMLALTITALLSTVVRSRWRAALIAALVAQPALVYAFALQGSVKELSTLWLVPLLAALVPGITDAADERADSGGRAEVEPRDLIPLVVASAASVALIGVAVLPWLGPVLLVALWQVWRRSGRSALAVVIPAAAFGAVLALLSLPTLLDLGDYLRVAQKVVTAQAELGNLLHPLDGLQIFGVWLQGDYRLFPEGGSGLSNLEITYLLIGVAAAAGLLGLGLLSRRRALGPALYVVTSLVALVYVTHRGSPWADAKALSIASPAVLLLAGLGVVALEEMGGARERRGPRAGPRRGHPPVQRHGLPQRQPGPEGPPRRPRAGLPRGGRPRAHPLHGVRGVREALPPRRAARSGSRRRSPCPGSRRRCAAGWRPGSGSARAADQIEVRDLNRFRSLVVRRSPVDARPPANWRRVWSGDYYDVWRRTPGVSVIEHLPAGATCARIGRLARRVAPGDARLAAAPPAAAPRNLPTNALPPGWAVRGDDPSLVQTVGPGTLEVRVPGGRAGSYEVWISGSIGRRESVSVDGRPAGSAAGELSRPPGWIHTGDVRLGPGHPRGPARTGGRGPAPGQRGRVALPRTRGAAPGHGPAGADGGGVAVAGAVRLSGGLDRGSSRRELGPAALA